jgi:EpsI family protein
MTQTSRLIISCSLLVAVCVALQFRSTGTAVPLRRTLDDFPAAIGQWQAEEATQFDGGVLNVLKVKDYLVRRYADAPGHNVWLYIGYWDTQEREAQIHSPKNCLPGAGWEPLDASRITIGLSAPYSPITINSYLVQKDRSQQLVFYWYQAQGQVTAGELAARIQMVHNAIRRDRTDGALVRVSSPIYDSVPRTAMLLESYIRELYPVLGQYLPD